MVEWWKDLQFTAWQFKFHFNFSKLEYNIAKLFNMESVNPTISEIAFDIVNEVKNYILNPKIHDEFDEYFTDSVCEFLMHNKYTAEELIIKLENYA